MPPRRVPWALLGFLALPLLLAPGLLTGEVFWLRDLWRYHWPMRDEVAAQLAAGRLPLWTSAVAGGVPLADNPAVAALYPGNVLVCWLPSGLGITWMCVWHLAVAGLGARALARAHGAGRWGSAIAGVAYAASGPVVSTVASVTHVCAAAWIPCALLGARRALAGRRDGAVLASLALALQVLGGEAQIALYTAGALALTAAIDAPRAATGGSPPWGMRAATLAAIAAGALPLAAAQVLPALTWIGEVHRSGFPLDVANQKAWAPDELLGSLLAPAPYGQPSRRLLGLGFGFPDHFLEQAWCGALPLLAACTAGGARRPGGRAPLAWIVLGGWLAIGVAGGLYAALWWAVPGFDRFRFPDKSLPFLALGVAVLAGRGVAVWAGGRAPSLRRVAAVLAAWAAAGALALSLRSPAPEAVDLLAGVRGGALAVGLAAAAVAALALAALGARRRPGPAWLAPAVALACTVADLVFANGPVLDTTPRSTVLTPSDRLAVFGPPDGFRLLHNMAPGRPDRIRQLMCDVPAFNRSYRALGFDYGPVLEGRAVLFPYETSPLRGYVAMVRRAGAVPRWYGALAGRDLVAEVAMDHPDLETIGGDGVTWFAYRNRAALPRARLVGAVEVVADLATARSRCLDPAFPHATTAVLMAGPEGVPRLAPAAAAAGAARIEADLGAEVIVATTAPGPALLVLADFAYPGWRVTIDGAPAPLHTVNGAFRGVAVPAGPHTVVFERRAPLVTAGLGLSLLALAAAGLLLGRSWIMARRAA